MSQPGIPDISPTITIERDQVLTLLLASIAVEEMGLAHILNAEGEKMQLAFAKSQDEGICLNQIIEVNTGVERVIRSITRLQLLLAEKLENVVTLIGSTPCSLPAPSPPVPGLHCFYCGKGSGTISRTDSDFAGAEATLLFCDETCFQYTLFKKGKRGIMSAKLVPLKQELKIRCLEGEPCLGMEKGNSLLVAGIGVMCIKMPCSKAQHSTVNFELKVCSCGRHSKFEVVTWQKDDDLFNHESGAVQVSSGELQVYVKKGEQGSCQSDPNS